MGTAIEGVSVNSVVLSILVLSVTVAIAYLLMRQSRSSPSFLSSDRPKIAKPPALSQQSREIEVSKASDAPDGWYTDAKTFEIERHAIFSQSWLCITHLSHFRKPGDYLSFQLADFPFFLILGKDNVLRGFHNVCRHRAYEVTRKPMGSSLVLGCRYHGWSYDSKGSLLKAPQFDQVPGFKKEDNGLFQIWVKTDPSGFVFINLDAKWDVFDPPSLGLETFARYSGASRTSSYVAFWQTEADMNWKQANALLDASAANKLEPRNKSLLDRFRQPSSPKHTAVYFPSAVSALTAIGGTNLWHMTVAEPISATRCSIRRTLYTTGTKATDRHIQNQVADLENEFYNMVKQLEAQFNDISSGHLTLPMGPTQDELSISIQNHMRKERETGKKIFPARPLEISSEIESANCGVAERLCRELEGLAGAGMACLKPGSGAQGLAW